MAKQATGKLRAYREVPNQQVLDAAQQFHSAYRVLAKQPPGSGVLLAELHCAFIALELYLKSLSAGEVEVPDSVLGFGSYIYAKSATKSHRLEDLYDLLDPRDQEIINNAVGPKDRLGVFPNARSALTAHNKMFISSRYPFEPESTLDEIEMGQLTQLLEALEQALSDIPRRHET
jgi:hypothetical protein